MSLRFYTSKSVKNIQLGEQWNDLWTIHSKNKVFVGVIIMDQNMANQLDNFYKIIQEAKVYLIEFMQIEKYEGVILWASLE